MVNGRVRCSIEQDLLKLQLDYNNNKYNTKYTCQDFPFLNQAVVGEVGQAKSST